MNIKLLLIFYIYSNVTCFNSFLLFVYDRWGQKVFSTNDPTGCWNGDQYEKDLSAAIFVYYFRAIYNNVEVIKKGNVSLIR